MKAQISEFQLLLLAACDGTSVTTRELVKEFSLEEIALIKSGDITLDEIKEIVLDLADSKDNEPLYKIPTKKQGKDEPFDGNLGEA